MAAMTESRGLVISLAALQRQDPYIFHIVDVASQVALYTFSQRDNEWEKTDVEGTLFVYARSASPRHGFTIMNRLNVENRTEPITKDLDFQLQDPFLLYRNAQFSIYGIWFYDKAECQRITDLMKNLTQLEQLKAQQGVESPNCGDSKAVDIVQMLFKAEHEYNKVKQSTEPKQITSSSLVPDNSNLIKPIPIKLTDVGTDIHYHQLQKQDEITEVGANQLNLVAPSGAQEQSSSKDISIDIQESKNKVSNRPAVVRSLSYEEPRRLPKHDISQSVKKQFCPAVQKLMSRGTDLQPVSELPENCLCENQTVKSVEEPLISPFQPHPLIGNVFSQQNSLNEAGPLFSTGTCHLFQKLHGTQRQVPSSCPATKQSEMLLCEPQNGSRTQPIPLRHPTHHTSSLQVQSKVLTSEQTKRTSALNSCSGQASGIISPRELLQKLQVVQQEEHHHAGKLTLAARFSAQQLPMLNLPKCSLKQFDSQTESTVFSENHNLFQVVSPQRIPATVVPSLLMSPMVFSQSAMGKQMIDANAMPLPQGDAKPAPKPQRSSLHPPVPTAEQTSKAQNVLTKIQLQTTLLFLLKNDPNFVNFIYETYLMSQTNTAAEK
ncbi:mRNA-decapping enzyme 1B isoform X1 [Amblyraja radiata]|uniref:mRNA-decapping enzyme 1B isoform X1 n=2 Tax=Amblyraja radiata TaxID=386614 RepID=UPI001403A56C|nr:mRNA-decapping enzyme 1B isoform X1 [Amblyraja radiata]